MISDVEPNRPHGSESEIESEKLETRLGLARAEASEREDAARALSERRTLVRLGEGETGPDGRFALEVPASRLPERYRLSVVAQAGDSALSAPGPWLDQGRLHDGALDAGDLLLRAIHRVSVAVRASGQPVDGALVTLGFGFESNFWQKQSGETRGGVARFDTLRSDHVHVTVERDGFATEFRDVATSGEEARVEIDLEPEASVTGQVRDSRGRPLPGAIVRARESARRRMRWDLSILGGGTFVDLRPDFHFELAESFVCDESGRYSIRGLAAGRRYSLEASKWDEAVIDATLEVVPPATNVDFVLGASSRLDVEVELKATPKRFAASSAPPHVWLEARDASGSWKQASIATAVDATHFRFDRVAPGLVRVGVAKIGLALTHSEPLTIVAGESARVRVEVGLGRAVSGRIVDPTGAPLAKVVVVLHAGRATARIAVTRADGRFEIEDLPLGDGEIAVGLQRIAVPAGVSSIPDIVHAPSDDDPDEPR
jgi:hypothetical protein